MPLLEVRDLVVEFPARRGTVRALDGVSFTIEPGQVLGIVGESGAGKTLTGSAIIGLIAPPGRMTGGEIRLAGERIDTLPPHRLRLIRGGRIGTIPQNPMTSLDPLQTVGRQLMETIRTHLGLSDRAAHQRATGWLEEVGIPAARERFDSYPHTFSGGMRQRVAVALALCAEPAVVVADEPTTALDVSVQAQIIGLLRRLTRDRGLAMMLVTHDMGVVAALADRVAVMYAGRIAETGPADAVIRDPAHPYTAGLIRCIPPVDRRIERLAQIDGAMPRPGAVPAGCAFHPRCDRAVERCRTERPELLATGGTAAACWVAGAAARAGDGAEGSRPGLNAASDPRDAARGASGKGTPPGAHAAADPVPAIPQATRGASGTGTRPGENAAADPMPAIPQAAQPDRDSAPLLELERVSHWFDAPSGLMHRLAGRSPRRVLAVDDVTLGVTRGTTLALVGESGCGKTTLARLAAGLLEPAEGTIRFAGQAVSATRRNPALRRRVNMVFQDPHGSLNPRWRVRDIIAEPIRQFGLASRAEVQDRVALLLGTVGLAPEDGTRFPHAFSGGQRQRIAIARALAATPDLLVCDEPTSALDVSVQAQILNLIRDLQSELGLTCLFISHDIAVVRQMADQVGVMYGGRIVELGDAASVLSRARHPYTRLLLDATPSLADRPGRRAVVGGEAPNASDLPAGCGFHQRCPLADARCRTERPALRGKGEMVACHAVQEGRADGGRGP